MNGIIGIIIFIGCGVVWTTFAICFSSEGILAHRYKRFYETTEEGKKLYCALYTKDRLGSQHDWLVNQMSELRDKINEFEAYFPEESHEKAFLNGMKIQYKEYSDEFYRTREAMADWGKRINEMVAALPKKYNGILEYNWENAKVEVEEGICW